MPVPTPKANEDKNTFISRCIETLEHSDTNRPHNQIQAICYGAWNQSKKAEGDSLNILEAAKWTRAYMNDLPDSAFLYVEPGGKKDSEGKTVPRTKRHLPYKDKGGKIDLPHLRNAIARLGQGKPFAVPANTRSSLMEKAKRILAKLVPGYKERQEKRAFVLSSPFMLGNTEVVEAEGAKRVVIKGDLMDDTVNKNHWRARAEELKNIAATFIGIPIKVQHSISDWEIVGTGKNAEVMSNHVPYAADITDRHAVAKFEDGTWNAKNMGISPKIGYETLICSICGGDAEVCEHVIGQEYNGIRAYVDVIGAHLIEASLTSNAAFKPSAGSIDDITLIASIDKDKTSGGIIMSEEETEETPPAEGDEELEAKEKELKEVKTKLESSENELKATKERLYKFVEAKRTEEVKKRINDEKLVAQILSENKDTSDEEFEAQLKKIDAIQATVKKENPPAPEGNKDTTLKGAVPPENSTPDLKAREDEIGKQLFGEHYAKLIGVKTEAK